MNILKMNVLKKKTIILILWIFTIAFAFYAGKKFGRASVGNEPISKTDYTISVSNDVTTDEQNQNVITQQEAEKLCLDVLGDIAEENGYPISYRCIDTVSIDGKMYYVMYIAWLVNNSHWSYIGNCYVSFDGQEIYDGIFTPAKYEIMGLRWNK